MLPPSLSSSLPLSIGFPDREIQREREMMMTVVVVGRKGWVWGENREWEERVGQVGGCSERKREWEWESACENRGGGERRNETGRKK